MAGLLCLCMVVSAMQPNMTVSAATNDMKIYVYAWHSGKKEADKIDLTGSPLGNDYNEPTCTLPSGRSQTISAPEYSDEEFTAFSISAGQSAVEIDEENTKVTVKNDPNASFVPIVKIIIFYSENPDDNGMSFGEAQSVVQKKDAEVDMVTVKENVYNKAIGATGGDSGKDVNVYDTSEGLHTNKDVKATQIEELNGKPLTDVEKDRTFDITLESWVAGDNLADIGLILDASGSMAWPATREMTPLHVDDKGIDESRKTDASGNKISYMLNDDELAMLDPEKTDNSLLGYSDYTYYVYDGRKSTKEYVPLGYWAGPPEVETDVSDMDKALLGYYPFEGNGSECLKNKAPSSGNATFIGKQSGNQFSSSAKNLPGDGELFREDTGDNASKAVSYKNGKKNETKTLVLYDHGNDDNEKGLAQANTSKGGNEGGRILLDTELTSNTFSISFAIRRNDKVKDKNNGYQTDTVLSDILYIGPIDESYTTSNSCRIYRDGKEKGTFINWDTNVGLSTAKGKISSCSGFFESNEYWNVVTYVVNGGKIDTYLDGKLVDSGTGTLPSINNFY